jgi:hypothetical protein
MAASIQAYFHSRVSGKGDAGGEAKDTAVRLKIAAPRSRTPKSRPEVRTCQRFKEKSSSIAAACYSRSAMRKRIAKLNEKNALVFYAVNPRELTLEDYSLDLASCSLRP